jgi:hypothetical protein
MRMEKNTTRKVAAGAVAAIAVAGGGVAIGATQIGSPKEESQAVVADAAKKLGIEPSKLSAALEQALEDRVDAAVASGAITKAEGDRAKAMIESGELPLFFAGGHHRPGGFGFRHHGAGLEGAAAYLGITGAQLRTELESGKTLAQIATAHGKTAAGLVEALYGAKKKDLDAAVAAGKLTRSQADAMLSVLKTHLTDLVNGTLPHFDHDRDGMPGFRGFRGSPPATFRAPTA